MGSECDIVLLVHYAKFSRNSGILRKWIPTNCWKLSLAVSLFVCKMLDLHKIQRTPHHHCCFQLRTCCAGVGVISYYGSGGGAGRRRRRRRQRS